MRRSVAIQPSYIVEALHAFDVHRKMRLFAALLALAWLGGWARPASAIIFDFVNGDGAGEGFNDPTLGAVRQSAFQHALSIWGGLLPSSYSGETISVYAQFSALGGSESSATLGQASPNLWATDGEYQYALGLANHYVGFDIAPGATQYEIFAEFNADVDNGTVLGSTDWYYGTDGLGGSAIDFVTVVLHEIGHGLGLLSLIQPDGNYYQIGDYALPSTYDYFLATGETGTNFLTDMTPAERIAAMSSGNLFWAGDVGIFANGGTRPELYAPAIFEPGSSVSHLDEGTFTNELMSPYYSGVDHTPGLITLGMLFDMGWGITSVPEPSSIFLTGTAVAAAGFLRRRRKRSSSSAEIVAAA